MIISVRWSVPASNLLANIKVNGIVHFLRSSVSRKIPLEFFLKSELQFEQYQSLFILLNVNIIKIKINNKTFINEKQNAINEK